LDGVQAGVKSSRGAASMFMVVAMKIGSSVMSRVLVVLLSSLVASAALAATGLKAGSLSEFNVELPRELREMGGRGQLSPVKHALIAVAVPASFDPARDWPVLVISATGDPQYHSSRRLFGAYANTAVAAGWIVVAADPAEDVSGEQDNLSLRYALNIAALAALELQWQRAGKAPLAFGGFSGGAKNSGWLAAAFAQQGRSVVGIYAAGINENTIVPAAKHFKVLTDAYKRIPIFLQSGEKDEIATPADHRRVADELRSAGFRNVRVESFPGPHAVEPELLRSALDWFRELSAATATAR
jgi:predicted esterase